MDPAMFGKILDALSGPWPEWGKNLLGRICGAYFPTIDKAKAVQQLETLAHEFIKEIRDPQHTPMVTRNFPTRARVWGHICAHVDYISQQLKDYPPEYRNPLSRVLAERPELQTCARIQKEIRNLHFQKRTVFLREFSFAYPHTFTASGKQCGRTKATSTYFKLLIILLAHWQHNRWPESVKELLPVWRKWRDLEPQPKPTPVPKLISESAEGKELLRMQQISEQAQRTEEEETELKWLRQLCGRIGLRFLPPRKKPRKHRRK